LVILRKKTKYKRKIIKGYIMEREFTAIIKQDGKWWIGWIEEVPGVNCQEDTRERLLQSLKDTLKEALEFNKMDAISAAGSSYAEERIAI
jgi:predicted RNase H-like HicB family nuclease